MIGIHTEIGSICSHFVTRLCLGHSHESIRVRLNKLKRNWLQSKRLKIKSFMCLHWESRKAMIRYWNVFRCKVENINNSTSYPVLLALRNLSTRDMLWLLLFSNSIFKWNIIDIIFRVNYAALCFAIPRIFRKVHATRGRFEPLQKFNGTWVNRRLENFSW